MPQQAAAFAPASQSATAQPLVLQGGETKRLYKTLGLCPGDAVKLQRTGKQSGIPTTHLTVTPRGECWASC